MDDPNFSVLFLIHLEKSNQVPPDNEVVSYLQNLSDDSEITRSHIAELLRQLNKSVQISVAAGLPTIPEAPHLLCSIKNIKILNSFLYLSVASGGGMKESSSRFLVCHDLTAIDFLHACFHVIIGDEKTLCVLCGVKDTQQIYKLIHTLVYLQDNTLLEDVFDTALERISPSDCLTHGIYTGYLYSNQRLFQASVAYSVQFAEQAIESVIGSVTQGHLQLNSLQMDLLKYFLNHPLLNVKTECLEKLAKLLNIKVEYDENRVAKNMPSQVFLEIEKHDFASHHTLRAYDADEGTLRRECPLEMLQSYRNLKLIGHSITAHDHKVYISCGEYGLGKGSWNPFIVLYNTLSECIRVLCEVQVKRRHHISLATDSFIFICGGYDKYRCHLYNTTRICLETGLQQELPPLPEGFYCSLPSSRIAHVTSPNGDVKLYVMSTSGDGLELDLASGNPSWKSCDYPYDNGDRTSSFFSLPLYPQFLFPRLRLDEQNNLQSEVCHT